MIITKALYVKSAVRAADCPSDLPQVAFLGRSNVGKSSLINSLVGVRNLARTSSKPGKTQAINFFEVTGKVPEGSDARYLKFHLVDLPGYGYAKAGKENRLLWAKFIEEYLTVSEKLAFVALLVDIRHDPMEIDKERLSFLAAHHIPVLVVATKADKVGKTTAAKNIKKFREAFGLPQDAVLPYSSEKNIGKAELLAALESVFDQGREEPTN